MREGTGETIQRGDTVFVFYRGRFADSKQVFDSNLDSETPLSFTAGGRDVIKALSLKSIGLKVGTTFVMVVPPEFGFGAEGIKDFIPPNATLIFEIVIVGRNELKFKDDAETAEPAAPVAEPTPVAPQEPEQKPTPVPSPEAERIRQEEARRAAEAAAERQRLEQERIRQEEAERAAQEAERQRQEQERLARIEAERQAAEAEAER